MSTLEATVSDIVASRRARARPPGVSEPTYKRSDCRTRQRRLVRLGFALCHPPSKPAIFIEVKQPGKAEDAVRQALEFTFHTGVSFNRQD